MTKKEALALIETKWWEGKTAEEIVEVQLFEDRVICPFGDVFHKALEEALGRPVWTHEFAFPETLREEFRGIRPKATFQDVVGKIPEDRQIIMVMMDGKPEEDTSS